MGAEFGYNIAFKVNNKTFAGRTQDNLTITPTIKESITKDDAGAKNNSVTGHEVTFSCQGLVVVSETGTTTKLMRDDIVALALAKGDSAKVPFSYQAGSGSTPLTGNAVITNYSENSNSEDEATYTVDLRSTGEVTFQ